MKNGKKKFLSAIAVLALTSATVCGAFGLAACGSDKSLLPETSIEQHLYTVSSAMGERTVEASGKTY